MYIDEMSPCSGSFSYLEGYEFIDRIEENTNFKWASKTLLRMTIAHLVLPIFTEIGFIYNFTLGVIKIPVYLLLRKYQTELFANQIKAHFTYALLDFISYKSWHYSPLSQFLPSYQDWHRFHYFWVFTYTIFPKETLKLVESLKKKINPSFSPPPVDLRLLDKPLL